MLEEINENSGGTSNIKRTVILLLCLAFVLGPFQDLPAVIKYYSLFHNYADQLAAGPVDDLAEIQLDLLCGLLSRNPYVGSWESSIKSSSFLQQESGKIEVQTLPHQSHLSNTSSMSHYNLRISIFDGWHSDNQFYSIIINTEELKTKQRFEQGKVLYETISPFLCHYQQSQGIKSHRKKSMYINKLKIKVFAVAGKIDVDAIRIEILLSSQYSINVIGREIYEYQQTFHDWVFSGLIMAQLLLQGFGIYGISENLVGQKDSAQRYSKHGFLLWIANDFTQAIALTIMCFVSQVPRLQGQKKFAIFLVPTLTSWAILIIIQLRILSLLFHEQYTSSSFKLTTKMYTCFSLLFLITYLTNLHWVYFLLWSSTGLFPQIYTNYKVGHKIKESMRLFLIYIMPRYFLIPYTRMYKYNVFSFETNWILGLVCLAVLGVQVGLVLVQVRFGVRSIVPRFLHPEELKYFLSEMDAEDDMCSICLVSIKEKALVESAQLNSLQDIGGEGQLQNNIVLTPCRHKFHIECLANSMKLKQTCPNCRCPLPPLQQYS